MFVSVLDGSAPECSMPGYNVANKLFPGPTMIACLPLVQVEVEPQHLSKLFGCTESAFTTRVQELRQLVEAAAEGLQSSTYPECHKHISALPVPPAAAHFTGQGVNDHDDNHNTLGVLENTTSRASDLSLGGDVTAAPGTAAAKSCRELLQRPATSATADVPQQAALPEAYAKLAVHDMIKMHDVLLPVKMQVPDISFLLRLCLSEWMAPRTAQLDCF